MEASLRGLPRYGSCLWMRVLVVAESIEVCPQLIELCLFNRQGDRQGNRHCRHLSDDRLVGSHEAVPSEFVDLRGGAKKETGQ